MNSELIFNSKLFKNKIPPTKTAFSLARSKINLLFFVDLFSFSRDLFYSCRVKSKLWKGFRLLAVDGTAVRVPDTPENRHFIGVHKNQHGEIAACRILAVHDVLNRVFVEMILHPRAVAELVAFHKNFDRVPKGSITIYDRHYCDSLLLDRHLKSNRPCVIRMKSKGIKVVDKFLESGVIDDVVEFKIGAGAYHSAKNKYDLKNKHPKFSKFRIRLIRVELDTGETEVLATNLFDTKKYPASDFKGLYGKRWGVETAFDKIKNQLKLAVFQDIKRILFYRIYDRFLYFTIFVLFFYNMQNPN